MGAPHYEVAFEVRVADLAGNVEEGGALETRASFGGCKWGTSIHGEVRLTWVVRNRASALSVDLDQEGCRLRPALRVPVQSWVASSSSPSAVCYRTTLALLPFQVAKCRLML